MHSNKLEITEKILHSTNLSAQMNTSQKATDVVVDMRKTQM